MANKKGLAYYRLDTDRYQDIRIKRLKKDFKRDGVAVYDYILCEIYRVEGCFLQWDESTAFEVANYWELKETTLRELVNYCCVIGLFDKHLFISESVLTSLAIQRRYTEMCRAAKRNDYKIPEKYKILPEEIPKTPEVEPKIQEDLDKVKNSKVKESKEEEGPPSPKPIGSELVQFIAREVWQDQIWKDNVCMGNNMKMEDLKIWMAKFNASVSNDTIENFTDSTYKKIFPGWVNKQKSNGVKVNEKIITQSFEYKNIT